MKSEIDYSLYLCTDRDLMTSSTVEESVEEAIQGMHGGSTAGKDVHFA